MNVFSDIDIQLDFSLLAEANASLSLQRITPKSSPTLRDLLIPWYVHAGIPVFHRDDEDKTLFPSVHRRLPEPGDRALSIGEVVDRFDKGDEPVHPFFKYKSIRGSPPSYGCYPAYNVGKNRLLLLDGSHRCISLVRVVINYHIELIVINGPVRREIMPDLAVFADTK